MLRRASSFRGGCAAALALLLVSCAPTPVAPPAGQLVDTGVIFTAAQAAAAAPDGRHLSGPFWTPGPGDVRAAEARLQELLFIMSNERAHRISTALPTYRRQYLGHSVDGRRQVFVSAFCADHWERSSAWHDRLVDVDDGGTCFFQARYDLQGDRIDELRIHPDG